MTTINKIIVVLSLLTLSLVAPTSAKHQQRQGLDDLCRKTSDPAYCSLFLRPLATRSTDFRSNAFLDKARARAAELAKGVSDFVNEHEEVDRRDISASRICMNKLRNSVDLIAMNDYDTAGIEQEACLGSLEHATGVMKDAREKVDEAMMATKVVNEIFMSHRR